MRWRRGGGRNHRIGLDDAVDQDNHLAWLDREADPIGTAMSLGPASVSPSTIVEVEVATPSYQLKLWRWFWCPIILVDNFDAE